MGKNSIIAAGALLLEGSIVEPGSVYGGVPAKKLKGIEEKHVREMIEKIADNYIKYASWYKA